MRVYIVVYDFRVRGVYSCGGDANQRIKFLGGGKVVISNLNVDV